MNGKKFLALLLALVMVFSLVACGNKDKADEDADSSPQNTAGSEASGNATIDGEAEVASKAVDVVKLCGSSDPGNLSPWNGQSGSRGTYLPMIYQSLITRTSSGEVEYCLAKSYEKIDELTYRVTLYDYIHDTEGNHLTADDIVFCYKTAKEIGKSFGINNIASVTAVDKYVVEFKYNSLSVGELYDSWSLWIVTEAAYKASPDAMATTPVGTNQYRLTEYVADYIMVGEKTHDYWQTDESLIDTMSMGNAERIEWYVISEAEQRSIGLKNGSLDQASISYNTVEELAGTDYTTVGLGGKETILLFCNMSENSILSTNKALREAIFYALDNENLAASNPNGPYHSVYDLLNGYYGDYYADDYKAEVESNYYKYDVAKAKELMAQAGYPDGGITLNLMCRNRTDFTDEATMIQAYLEEIGIDVKINTYDIAMLSEYATDPTLWDLYLFANGSENSYGVGLYTKLFDDTNYSWGGAVNFAVDETLQEKLDACSNPETYSEETMKEFRQYVIDQAYAMGLMQDTKYTGYSAKVVNVINNLAGNAAPQAWTYAD